MAEKTYDVTELFGSDVFNEAVMKARLPKAIFKELMKVMHGNAELTLPIAEVVASTMKDWAVEKGATHYTHWFQPMTGITAEKHDSFISPVGDGTVIMEFSGKELIKGEQTDKDGYLVYLYATDKTAQYSYIKNATDKGYDVLLIDDQLGSHFVGMLEQKLEKARFVRVDSDILENLIVKADRKSAELSAEDRSVFTELFRSQIPAIEKTEFLVTFEALSAESSPVMITQSEYMRRMKEMAAMQRGMSFYGELPDTYSLILNTEHPLVKRVMEESKAALAEKVSPLEAKIADLTKTSEALREKKDATDAEKEILANNESQAEALRKEENEAIKAYAQTNPLVRQMIDIALLGNNLLKGEALDSFLKRSIDLLK